MWWVTMLSIRRGIAVMEGTAGSGSGHDVSVWRQSQHGCDVSALSRSIPTLAAVWKMSSWEWVRACVGVNPCTHVTFVRFFVHVHALPFLWLIQMNDRVQSVPSSVVRTVRLSLFHKIEGYLCLYWKSQLLLYPRKMLHTLLKSLHQCPATLLLRNSIGQWCYGSGKAWSYWNGMLNPFYNMINHGQIFLPEKSLDMV